MTSKEYICDLCNNAKSSRGKLALSDISTRNKILENIIEGLKKDTEAILSANEEDLRQAKACGMAEAMCDRLKLDRKRIDGICVSLSKLIALPEVIGKSEGWTTSKGLIIKRVRVPLGTIGIIYEARPNVTVDAAALCIKSGNAVILRGGKEAINTNSALESVIKAALEAEGISGDCVNLIHDTSRESSVELMKANRLIDVLIPRGSASLINSVVENATVPVIQTGAGNCHIYIDKYADMQMALKIAVSAKISRPSVCNAEEKLLVHKDIADTFLPIVIKAFRENGVEVRGDEKVCSVCGEVIPVCESDLTKEYNDYIISIYTVESIDEAINHINAYNTGHSEAIITENLNCAAEFQSRVDAAAVYVNASTRFTDGEEFGFGAEIGISTQKLHARGPCGLTELTTFKYLINGNGQTR